MAITLLQIYENSNLDLVDIHVYSNFDFNQGP